MADLKIATIQPVGVMDEAGLEPANMSSGTAQAGLVLTADGNGACTWSAESGMGDVTGPAGATDGGVAVFDGETGKVIKDPTAAVDFGGQQTANLDVSNLDPSGMSSGAALAGQAPLADGNGAISWGSVTPPTQVRTLYVGKHGNDSNGGGNVDDAFLTIGAAITEANALTPSSGSPVVIRILDDGTYTESITLAAHVSLEGRNAHVTYSTTSTDVVRANDQCRVRLGKVSCGGTNGYCVTSDPDSSGEVFFDIGELAQTGSGRLVGNRSSNTKTFLKADHIIVTGVQRGAIETASNAAIVLDIKKILLAGNTAYGLLNFNSVAMRGKIGSIEKSSPGLTGTVGIVGGINPYSVVCGRIEADNAIDCSAGQTMSVVAGLVEGTISVAGTLYLIAGRHIGSTSGAGTINKITADAIRAGGGLGVFGVTPPGAQPSKISDPSDLATALTAIAAIIDVLEGAGLSAQA